MIFGNAFSIFDNNLWACLVLAHNLGGNKETTFATIASDGSVHYFLLEIRSYVLIPGDAMDAVRRWRSLMSENKADLEHKYKPGATNV